MRKDCVSFAVAVSGLSRHVCPLPAWMVTVSLEEGKLHRRRRSCAEGLCEQENGSKNHAGLRKSSLNAILVVCKGR